MEFLYNNLAPLLASAEGKGCEEHGIGWNIFVYSGLVVVVALLFATVAKKGLTPKTFISLPAKLAEHLYLFLRNMATNVIGDHGVKYVPFLLALWLFIFVANVLGLVLQFTPTADWSLNLSLAFITVAYVQYEGARTNGILGHLRHFAGPKLPLSMIYISVLLFVVEIVSEMMKLGSLSIRLFGNIEGGHIVKESLDGMMHFGAVTIPLGGLLLPIKLFTCVIQAYVFTILTCVYLNAVTHHEEDHDDHHADESHSEPALSHS